MPGNDLSKYIVRPFQPILLNEVLCIEQACYQHPWSAEHFLQELQNPASHVDLLYCEEQLVGYICYWLIVGEMQILNIAVAVDWRRQGMADRLLKHAFVYCQQQGLERSWLEVRIGNSAAIALYRRHGFNDDTIRRGYYRDGEDALLMSKSFSDEMDD